MTKILSVNKLELISYRNFSYTSCAFTNDPVIITCENGSGKTNLLEAISFISPGRGFRNAKLSQIVNQNDNLNKWGIFALLNGIMAPATVKTEYICSDVKEKRYIEINGQKALSNFELTQIFSVIWLTPQMDHLFLASNSERRKFFDRLVYNFDNEHASRINKYEYFMRERNLLLKDFRFDLSWISIIEEKMSKLAVSIAKTRMKIANYLQFAIDESQSNFPKAKIKILGELEGLIDKHSEDQIEEYYKKILNDNRKIDHLSGRTKIGPHRSDFIVTHVEKQQEACFCSTGEQKALLISLILANIKAKIKFTHIVPVVLFDEVIAHIDQYRKEELFAELLEMKCQFFLTGVEKNSFSELKNKAQFFSIHKNEISY